MDVWIINWKVRIQPDRDNAEGHVLTGVSLANFLVCLGSAASVFP